MIKLGSVGVTGPQKPSQQKWLTASEPKCSGNRRTRFKAHKFHIGSSLQLTVIYVEHSRSLNVSFHNNLKSKVEPLDKKEDEDIQGEGTLTRRMCQSGRRAEEPGGARRS